MSFPVQICRWEAASERLRILDAIDQYPRIEVADIRLPVRLMASSSRPATLQDGYIFGTVGQLQIYGKTSVVGNWSMFPAALSFLLSACDGGETYDARNYLVMHDGAYNVFASKASVPGSSDLPYILKQKVLHSITVDFQSALLLLRRVNGYVSADLDLRGRELVLKTNTSEYSSRISVTANDTVQDSQDIANLLDSVETLAPIVHFPPEVFRNILRAAPSKTITLDITKSLVRIKPVRGLLIACRRGS
jgi:hypothetical protein